MVHTAGLIYKKVVFCVLAASFVGLKININLFNLVLEMIFNYS